MDKTRINNNLSILLGYTAMILRTMQTLDWFIGAYVAFQLIYCYIETDDDNDDKIET